MNEERNPNILSISEEDLSDEKNIMNSFDYEGEVPLDLGIDLDEYVEVEIASREKREKKKIDISTINIIQKNPIEKEKDLRTALYGNKSAFQIVAAQSGYMAKVVPLVHKDTINLTYSNLNRYEYKKAVFKVVYDKVMSFSVGKMSFEEWLKLTSAEDLETFFYGIYCSTFPKDGNVEITCPNCGIKQTYSIGSENLVKTSNRDEMKKRISDISSKALSRDAMSNYSLIGKNEAIMLQDSGIVVEIRTPSLWDSLELLNMVPEKMIDKDQLTLTNMLYVERLLIPSQNQGKDVSYIEERDRQEILRIIDNMSVYDANELNDAVSDRVEENRITYSIQNIKCPSCEYTIKEIPISLEDTLFQQIFENGR